MSKLIYTQGDATTPAGDGQKILAHVCNNVGAWGRGFVLAVSARWKLPEKYYRKSKRLSLGDVQFVRVSDEIVVGNMIAQNGVGTGRRRLNYKKLRVCLGVLRDEALLTNASIHMPRIGSGLAGGDWNIIETLLQDVLVAADISVTVYSL